MTMFETLLIENIYFNVLLKIWMSIHASNIRAVYVCVCVFK